MELLISSSHFTMPFTPQQGLAIESQNGVSGKGVLVPESGFGVGENNEESPDAVMGQVSHAQPTHLCSSVGMPSLLPLTWPVEMCLYFSPSSHDTSMTPP